MTRVSVLTMMALALAGCGSLTGSGAITTWEATFSEGQAVTPPEDATADEMVAILEAAANAGTSVTVHVEGQPGDVSAVVGSFSYTWDPTSATVTLDAQGNIDRKASAAAIAQSQANWSSIIVDAISAGRGATVTVEGPLEDIASLRPIIEEVKAKVLAELMAAGRSHEQAAAIIAEIFPDFPGL